MLETTSEIKRRCIELVRDEHAEGSPHTFIDRSFFRDFDRLKGVIALELHKHGFRTLSIKGDLLVTKF